MARTKGIIKLKGKKSGFIFYKNLDIVILALAGKGGVDAARIANTH